MIIRRKIEQVNAVRRSGNTLRISVKRDTVMIAQRFGVVNISRAGAAWREDLTISSNGQTVFNLGHISAAPHLSQLSLNGVLQKLGADYSINSSVLTYTSSVPISTTDVLIIYYS